MRILSIALALAGTLTGVQATTLQKLSMDQMIKQSTAIVHARISGSRGAFRGTDIYTYYQLDVLETLKGSNAAAEVAIPGGAAKGLRQSVAGAPSLTTGGEYVIFLWTSPSGLTQVIGLSQGLFSVVKNSSGSTVLVRPGSGDLMLDQAGHPVANESSTLTLSDLKSQIGAVK